MVTAYSKLSWN